MGEFAPPGVNGSAAGLAGRQRLITAEGAVKEPAGCFSIAARPGDAIEIETPGGGGFGLPDARRGV
jgi:5-oxoprolinase (ATP-hydrolysing)